MKVIFINKKVIAICLLAILFIILSIFFISSKNTSFAIELSQNSTLSEDISAKILGLTKGTEKVAFLTFDDGPNVSVTPKVLDILKDEEVKASFFVIGKNVQSEFSDKVEFLEFDFKKQNGFLLTTKNAKKEGFYRQNYCGCVYSIRKNKI